MATNQNGKTDGFKPMPHRYSYSGADVKAFAYYPGAEIELALLESLGTISVSVHEAKGQVRALGYRGIKGISKGIRTIAGSLIMTVIEDHPLRRLVELIPAYSRNEPIYVPGWSIDREMIGVGTAFNRFNLNNRLVTLLPPIDIFVQYISESSNVDSFLYPNGQPRKKGGYEDQVISALQGALDASGELARTESNFSVNISGAGMLLCGVEFVDEGIVSSVNDVVTEMSFSFIARDFKPIAGISLEHFESLPNQDQARQNDLFSRLFSRSPDQAMRKAIRQGAEITDYSDPLDIMFVDPDVTTTTPNALQRPTGTKNGAIVDSLGRKANGVRNFVTGKNRR